MTQGKLVRDKIPDIIRREGLRPRVHTASTDEFFRRLRAKLEEEVAEFLHADPENAPEELADVLEVVYVLAAELGLTPQQLERIREQKATERGSFSCRIVWTGNEDTAESTASALH